jgi:tetratricopeptide (TPR) repeat protein
MCTRSLIACGLCAFVCLSVAPGSQAVLAIQFAQSAPRAPDLESLRALLDAGKDLEAEQGALARVAAIERDRGPDDAEIAALLDFVLEARLSVRRVGNTAGSPELAERALGIKEKAYGPDDPRVAETLVLVTFARRDFKGRLAAAERAVAIHERTLGPGRESLGLARALSALAWVHWQARRLPIAIQTGERALAMARRLESPAGQETASVLNTLAGSHRTNGQIDQSVRFYEEALAIEERMRGPGHPATTYTMISFASALFDYGEFDRARALHEGAIEILEHTPGSERRLAFEMISLSNTFETYGEYAAAFAMCERGVAVAERVTGADSAVTVAGIGKLAALHQRLGDHAAASAIRARTLERWTALQGGESLHVATALIELAASYESAGEIDKAFETLDRAMKMEALVKQPIVHADGFELLGSLLMTQGRLTEAREALERAHAMDAASKYDSGRRGQAATLRLLGRLDRREGQAARAVPRYREAVQLMEREFGPASINTAEMRTEFAEALAEAGMIDEAREALVASETASLDHLRLIARALPDRRALAFAKERRSGIDLAVTLATREAAVAAGGTPRAAAGAGAAATTSAVPAPAPTASAATKADVEMALQMLIQGRTVVLDEMASRQRTVSAEAENAAVRERWTTLNRARARLANLIVRGAEGS